MTSLHIMLTNLCCLGAWGVLVKSIDVSQVMFASLTFPWNGFGFGAGVSAVTDKPKPLNGGIQGSAGEREADRER